MLFEERSLDSELFILDALFLCTIFLFAARSDNDIAIETAFWDFLFLAILIAASRLVTNFVFTTSFLLDDLNALLAVRVTGIIFVPVKKLYISVVANHNLRV